jgi:hypothetical protein
LYFFSVSSSTLFFFCLFCSICFVLTRTFPRSRKQLLKRNPINSSKYLVSHTKGRAQTEGV